MKKLSFLFILFLAAQTVSAQKSITLDQIWTYWAYYPNYLWGLNSMNDGKHYTVTENNTIVKYAYKSGEEVSRYSDIDIDIDNYQFSEDETKILVGTNEERIYRHSRKGEYYCYDLKTKKMIPLPTHNKIMVPQFNPAGNRVAYVADNNIYIYDLEAKKETQVTNDGKINFIINGHGDWVYEEELVVVRAFDWSPDGKKIAYLRFDETNVPQFEMATYRGKLYPKDYVFKYPKVGEKNANVTAHVYDVENGATAPITNLPEYEYIPRIKWANAGELIVFTMNRLQNHLVLNRVDKTMKASKLFEEKAPSYLEINDHLQFLKDGSFIWVSENDGYNHIYLYSKDGKLIRQITKGQWDVTDVYGVDEKSKLVYYSSAEVSPMERHLYSITLDGKKKTQLTKKKGVNEIEFTSGFQYYICTHSTISSPGSTTLYDKKGNLIRELVNNKTLDSKIESTGINKPEFIKIKNSEGTDLNGYVIKPVGFDPSKKYPVFMYVYGGPGSQEVMDQWQGNNYMWFQMLAQKGYMIACVDNRGTGARGRDFRTCTYEKLGKLEVDDQIDAANYFASLPYVDKDRIGIFGWSYGGYMTSLCITRGANVFKTAIAVAPVSNWKYYDSIYTERYMGTKESNPNGYDDNAPTAFTDKLKGNFLLVHGTADDNVHWQNSAELINALVKSNKQFDLFIYPDRNHSIYGGNTRYHLYNMMTDFIMENL